MYWITEKQFNGLKGSCDRQSIIREIERQVMVEEESPMKAIEVVENILIQNGFTRSTFDIYSYDLEDIKQQEQEQKHECLTSFRTMVMSEYGEQYDYLLEEIEYMGDYPIKKFHKIEGTGGYRIWGWK